MFKLFVVFTRSALTRLQQPIWLRWSRHVVWPTTRWCHRHGFLLYFVRELQFTHSLQCKWCEKKLVTNLERPSPNFPLQPPTQSFILPVQVHPNFSHFMPSLKATRIPRHLNFSHFMHLPKPQKIFWPASVSMLSRILWLVNFFISINSKLLSCAKSAPNFSRFLTYLFLLEITHITSKVHVHWCWL